MTNKEKLEKLIEESGLKREFIAEKLGITRFGLAKKISNESEFKVSEVYKMQKIFGLSDRDRDEIFFADSIE